MRIGILSAERGEEDVDENKRLSREILKSGNRPITVNYQKTVVAITKKGQMLCQFDKHGNLKAVKLDAVIPRVNEADEQSIELAALALQTLLSNGTYTTARPEAIRLAKSKIWSQIALSANGIPTPRTAAVTGTETYPLDEVLKKVEPNANRRLIKKTNIGTHGRGVMPANSRGEARAIVEGFLASNVPVLVQEFMEPRKRNKYIDLRLVVVGGKVIASMKRESVRKDEIRANLSLGGEGSAYMPSLKEIEMAEKAAAAVGLPVAGVDILPSTRGMVVIEVNASPGFLVEDVTDTNVAKAVVKMVTAALPRRELQISLLKPVKQIRKMPAMQPALKTIQNTKTMISEAFET